MNGNQDQQKGGYFYEPFVSGGRYETSLTAIGRTVGQIGTGAAVVVALTVFRPLLSKSESVITMGLNAGPMAGNVAAGGVGTCIGNLTGSLFGEAGYAVDNIESAANNINTFFGEINDPKSWMSPEDFDEN